MRTGKRIESNRAIKIDDSHFGSHKNICELAVDSGHQGVRMHLGNSRVTALCATVFVLCSTQLSYGAAGNPPDATSSSHLAASLTKSERYTLHLHHLHTGEDLDIVYKVGDRYVPGAIERLNYFLRDHRTNDVSHYDLKEFDLLHTVMAKLGRPNGIIDIVCGYRTPWSNTYLRTRAAVTGVAQNSQHVLAKAIDIRVPGITTRHLRDIAESLHEGGVGYYPVSKFVHVDVGPVRRWTFSGAGD